MLILGPESMSRRVSPLAGFQVTIIGRFWVTTEEETADSCLVDFLHGEKWWKDVMQFYVLMIRNPLGAIRWIEATIRKQHLHGKTTISNAEELKRLARKALTPA
jgi:hypothetical protein